MDAVEQTKDWLVKIRSLSETKKKIIFFMILIIAAVLLFFWGIRITQNNFNTIQRSLSKRNINLDNNQEVINNPSNSTDYAGILLQENQKLNWQNYNNDTYGFELQYPPNFFIEEQKLDSLVYLVTFIDNKFKEGDRTGVDSSLNVEIIKTSLTPKEFIENNFVENAFISSENISEVIVGNKKALYFSFQIQAGDKIIMNYYTIFKSGSDTLFALKHHKVLDAIDSNYSTDIYQNFLSSFKIKPVN